MNYLIPANTKKGSLIFGLFRPFDLILFGTGVLISIIFLALIPLASVPVTILILSPAIITGFLVVPIPYYHNMLTVFGELIEFLTNRQKYIWKGWCVEYGEEDQKSVH